MDLEKSNVSHEENITPHPGASSPNVTDKEPIVYTDPHGLPLSPQPTPHKDNPLNWSFLLKLSITLQVSWLGLIGSMGAACANPAFVLMSEHFQMSVPEISYELTMYLVFGGIGPLIVVPFARTYGRRPVYLLGTLVIAVTNIAAGYCDSWAGIMATRAFNGIASGSIISLGAATICDLYFTHQRGIYMGIYTFAITNGAHVAPLVGGFVASSLGWRATFYIPGFIQAGTLPVILFCLPETLYTSTSTSTPTPYREQSFLENLLFAHSHVPGTFPRLTDFTRPFRMLRCIVVLLNAAFYMACFGYGSVMFAFTGAKLFSGFYGFSTTQIGLMLSIPLLIGCLIGELSTGWVVDWMSNRHARRHDGERLPEARLNAIGGALLIPVGIIIEGFCLADSGVHWVGSAFGMGIANLGLQVATTVMYSYTTDCYKPQSAEVSTILNVFRHIFPCFISFYALHFADRIGIQWAWLTLALILVVLFIPVALLRVYGPRIRSRPSQSVPAMGQ